MKKLIYLFLFIFSNGVASSQSISIYNIDASNFPVMRAKFNAIGLKGELVKSIAEIELSLYENGIPRDILSVSCPPDVPPRDVSTTIVFNVANATKSGSLDIAKSAAKAWIGTLTPGSECAITSVDKVNSLNQDFTSNSYKLNKAVDLIGESKGIDYRVALAEPPAGGIIVAKAAKNKRVIILLTDGLPNRFPDELKIIKDANDNNITIHCITINMHAHESLKRIAEATGGLWFENVRSREEAEEIGRQIKSRTVYGESACDIEWKSAADCIRETRNVESKWGGCTSRANYFPPSTAKAELKFSPVSVYFANKPIGVKSDTTIEITAVNSDFDVESVHSTSPFFKVSPNSFTLKNGETKTITVSYTPPDSNSYYSFIRFKTRTCTGEFYAMGGYTFTKSTVNTLELTSPNGGESFIAGSDTIITWTGALPTDKVTLEYSIDNGKTWKIITKEATGLQYAWKNVPKPTSFRCLIRITSRSKEPLVEWSKTYNRCYFDAARDIKQTKNGNYIVVGESSDLYGDSNVWILYLNQAGDIIWGKSIGGANDDKGYAVVETQDGGFAVGSFTISDDGNLKDKDLGAGDFWIVKLNVKGDIEWSRTYGGEHPDRLFSLTGAKDGGIICAGLTSSHDHDVSFNYLKDSLNPTDDVWVVKIDKYGNIEWEKSYGGYGGELAKSIKETKDGGFILAGSTNSSDGDLSFNRGETDAWVIKITKKGVLEWQKTYGGASDEIYNSICETDEGEFIVAGITNSTGGDVSDYKGHSDAWISCIGADGSLKWSKTIGGSGEDFAFSAVESDDHGVIFVGATHSYDGDINRPDLHKELYMPRFWIKKVGYGGDLEWQKIFNEKFEGQAFAIERTSDKGYIITGVTDDLDGQFSNYVIVKLSPDISSQTDVSDSLFAIVAPEANSFDVDMGKVLVGDYKDSVIKAFVVNKGSAALKIDDIRLTGADAEDFYVISGSSFVLIPGEKREVAFHFEPSAVGKRYATIEIVSQDSLLRQRITGEGVLPMIEVLSNIIDFGALHVGDRKDTAVVLIKNLSSETINITDTKMLGPDVKQFEIISGGGYFSLAPDSTRELVLRFEPVYIGRTSGGIGFFFNGIGTPARTHLFGQAVGGRIYCTSDSASAGGRAVIYLKTVGVSINSFQKLASAFRANVEFNKTLLAPVDNTLISNVSEDSTTVELRGSLKSDSVLYALDLIAGLGNTDFTTIEIKDFKWIDVDGNDIEYEVETVAGSFRLLGVCREGGDRFIMPTSKAGIFSITPNPASEEITITVNQTESGETYATVYDILGNEVLRKYMESNNMGKKDIKLDVAKLSSGVYFLKYSTPTSAEVKRIMIK